MSGAKRLVLRQTSAGLRLLNDKSAGRSIRRSGGRSRDPTPDRTLRDGDETPILRCWFGNAKCVVE